MDWSAAGLPMEGELAADPEATAEEAMRPGPTTVRPDAPAGNMAERMKKRGASSVLVTTPDGVLVGRTYRDDAERIAHEQARTSENSTSTHSGE